MLLGFLALAVLDSINPSAIVVTLYLLSHERVTAQIVVYVAAIFLTYLTLGAMMMVGIDALLPSLRTTGTARLGFIVQGLIGLALLLYAIRRQRQPHQRGESSRARAHMPRWPSSASR